MMEATDPDTIVDSVTGAATTVPEEHRAGTNGQTQSLGAPAQRVRQVPGRPVAQPHAKAWHQAGEELTAWRRTSKQLSHTQAGPEIGQSRHPIVQMTERTYGSGLHHEAQMMLWHVMREYIPVLDAAIGNRRQLEGDLIIESEDEGLQQELRDWWASIPVGYLGGEASLQGGDTYLNMLAENADEYGLGLGETLLSRDGRDIRRLVVPNGRTIQSADRDGDGIFELYQGRPDRIEREDEDLRLDNRPTVQTIAFRPSTESHWPYPLMWSLKKVGEAFLRITASVINGWWRFGDPSMHWSIEYDPESQIEKVEVNPEGDQKSQEVPKALMWLRDGMAATMQARREGKVGDMYSYVEGGEISSEVVGDVDNSLMQYVREHWGHIAAQVIEHSDTPPWMYPSIQQVGDGLQSERSTNMALAAAVAADKRNRRKKAVARDVLDTLLTVRGDAQFVGSYELHFDRLAIMDEKVQADADLQQAKADQQATKVAGLAFGPDGERRFSGEAEDYLERNNVYQSEE